MKYTIEPDNNAGICMIHVSGINKRPDDSIILQNVVRDIRSKTGCRKFLFDMRQSVIIGSTLDTLDTAMRPIIDGFERDFRIALVYTGNLEEHIFMEDVVVNRGYSLHIFTDIEDATLWLT